jgi:hypothetical protein
MVRILLKQYREYNNVISRTKCLLGSAGRIRDQTEAEQAFVKLFAPRFVQAVPIGFP